MVAGLLLSLLAAHLAPPDYCEEVLRRNDELFYQYWLEWPVALSGVAQANKTPYREVIRSVREARECVTNHAGAMRLSYRETYAYLVLGEHDIALASFDSFFQEFTPTEDSLWLGFMYRLRGYTNVRLGDFTSAFRDYGAAIAYSRGRPVTEQADLLIDVGAAYRIIRDIPAALSTLDQVDRLLSDAIANDTLAARLQARSYLLRADALLDWGDQIYGLQEDSTLRVIHLLENSLAKYGSILAGTDLARTHLVLTSALGYAGRIEEGHAHLDEAVRLTRHSTDIDLLTEIARHRARLYLYTGEYEAAESVLAAAQDRIGERSIDFDVWRRLLIDIGLCYEISERHELAAAAYRRVIDLVDEQIRSLGTNRWSASAYSPWNEGAHRGLVRALLAQGKTQEAFVALEESRARYLTALAGEARQMGHLSAEHTGQLMQIDGQLRDVRNQLLYAAPGSAAEIDLLRAEAGLMASRTDLLHPPSDVTIDVEAIQHSLESRTLLSYFIDWDSPDIGHKAVSHVFILQEDGLQAIALPKASSLALEAHLAAISPVVTAGLDGRVSSSQFSLNALHELYLALVAPASHLLGNEPLLIIPDGPLFYTPMAALVERATPAYAYHDAPYLVKRHAISFEPAAHLIGSKNIQSTELSGQVALVGKSTFEDVRREPWSATSGTFRASLTDLPFVTREINAIRRMFSRTETLVDARATESSFVQLLDQNPSVLHVASHVQFDPYSWSQSAILLSTNEQDGDGRLAVHELLGRQFAAQMVVLSGCNTMRGPLSPGEGMLGLRFAFEALGVQSTVATMWLVSDRSTAQLMEMFYDNIRQGMAKDEALRQAQLTYLEQSDPNTSSAFYWAAPVVYGDVSPIMLASRNPLIPALPAGWKMILAIFCVLGLLALWASRRRLEERYAA
jgi:CHAT domain-containing protein/tetratricopeptide (TPR) repeat protein